MSLYAVSRIGVVRAVHFGRTEEEAVALLRDANYAGFYNYFGGVDFWEAFRMPEDAAKYPDGVMLPTSEWTVERMRKAKYALAGTPDQVKAEFDALKRIGGEGELEWFAWFFDQGAMGGGDPPDRALRRAHHPGLPLSGVPPAPPRHTRAKIEAHCAQQDGRGQV